MLDCILNGKTIYAWKVHDREADYRCPMCNNPVRLKRGNKKIPHFAHISSNECSYGEGVSEDHLVVQKEITEILSSNNIQCKLEYRGIKNIYIFVKSKELHPCRRTAVYCAVYRYQSY